MNVYKCVRRDREPIDDSPEARSLRCQSCLHRLGLLEAVNTNSNLSAAEHVQAQHALAGCLPGPKLYEHVGIVVCGDPTGMDAAAEPFIGDGSLEESQDKE